MLPSTPWSAPTYSSISSSFARRLSELRRVARRRLILVVPQEREYRFTFNPHLHFFPYPHSFLRYLTPVPQGS